MTCSPVLLWGSWLNWLFCGGNICHQFFITTTTTVNKNCILIRQNFYLGTTTTRDQEVDVLIPHNKRRMDLGMLVVPFSNVSSITYMWLFYSQEYAEVDVLVAWQERWWDMEGYLEIWRVFNLTDKPKFCQSLALNCCTTEKKQPSVPLTLHIHHLSCFATRTLTSPYYLTLQNHILRPANGFS